MNGAPGAALADAMGTALRVVGSPSRPLLAAAPVAVLPPTSKAAANAALNRVTRRLSDPPRGPSVIVSPPEIPRFGHGYVRSRAPPRQLQSLRFYVIHSDGPSKSSGAWSASLPAWDAQPMLISLRALEGVVLTMDEVVEVGVSAVPPVHHVVGVGPGRGSLAARPHAALVPNPERGARRARRHPERSDRKS